MDKKIRVSINSWGGLVLYIPKGPNNKKFIIWNRLDGRYSISKDGKSNPDVSYASPIEAFFSEFNFKE